MPPIDGHVAEVLDQYRVVANIGENDGVEEGMKFLIYEEEGGYTDPETGEDLGTRRIEKGAVEVVELYEKMSVMETFETIHSSPISGSLFGTSSKKKLPTDSSVEQDERTIERGDSVVQMEEDE